MPVLPISSSLVSPIPVPTYGKGGTFSVLAQAHILVPPRVVLDAVQNTHTWHLWNSFTPSLSFMSDPGKPDGWLKPGFIATLDVFMKGDGLVPDSVKSRDQGIEVTVLETLRDGREGWRVAWKSTGYKDWQLRSERVMEFVKADGGTDYTCWETFSGVLAPVVKRVVGRTLGSRFEDYARDVKEFVERGVEHGEGKGRAREANESV